MRKPKAPRKKPVAAKGGPHHAKPAPAGHGPVIGGGSGGSVHHRAPVKKPKPPKRRKLSPGSDVACCTAQALGTLLGWGWDDVLALYWRTASDPDSGATILDTLQAATERYPAIGDLVVATPRIDMADADTAGQQGIAESDLAAVAAEFAVISHPLILGVSLPEPHAIAVTPDGTWWSWGEPYCPCDFPGAVIEEAWAVLI